MTASSEKTRPRGAGVLDEEFLAGTLNLAHRAL
jgi:hypothetical protein